jgi:hypothetical protein
MEDNIDKMIKVISGKCIQKHLNPWHKNEVKRLLWVIISDPRVIYIIV